MERISTKQKKNPGFVLHSDEYTKETIFFFLLKSFCIEPNRFYYAKEKNQIPFMFLFRENAGYCKKEKQNWY